MKEQSNRVKTGVTGLDKILHGGLIAKRSYLLRGQPGTGKTILGLHYLTTGVDNDETTLFINLEEPTADIKRNASTINIDVTGVEFLDLTPDSDVFVEDQSYDLFPADEVEQSPLTDEIVNAVNEIEPDRVVVDPITQLRYLSSNDYQFRKQVIGLGRFLNDQDATVLYTSQATSAHSDDDLQFISDGTIELGYGPRGRTIDVPKFRGSDTVSGDHTVKIRDQGIVVYPELRAGEFRQTYSEKTVSSGVPEIDELLHGGIERGTVSILSGPTGVGKTTLGTQFMKEAAGRGERSVVYLFEENQATFLKRSQAINIPVREMYDQGTLSIEEVEPLEVSPQEFSHNVQTEVEDQNAQIVMIDGIDGYKVSLRGDEDHLVRKIHALCRYLKNMGVTVILVDEISTITGNFQPTDTGISYLADNIIFLRHLELKGELRKAIGVLKKRTSDFERMLRQYRITQHGIKVGEPLDNLRGILTGMPELSSPNHENLNDT